MNNNYHVSWHHDLIANKLEEVLKKVKAGIPARLIIQVPPRHGKTQLATIYFPAWILSMYPEMAMLVASYNEELAEEFGMKTRDVLNNDLYKIIFPGTKLREDSKAKRRWHTDQGGGFMSTGIGGSITGRGFKIGIIDDPIKNREEANSKIKREMVWNWYLSTFYTRQEGATGIIVILTRWHPDDLVGRLLRKQKDDERDGIESYDKWDVIDLPAIATRDEQFRKVGEPLWPAKFDTEKLAVVKNTIGPYEWSALYQQKPITSETQEITKQMFHYEAPPADRISRMRFVTTVDLAISKRDHADRTAIVTVGKEADRPEWWIVRNDTGRFDPIKTIDLIFNHQSVYRSDVYLETVAYQKALKYFLEEEMRRTQKYFIVHEINSRKRKEERIRGLVPLFHVGVIKCAKQFSELEEEALSFPFGVHDDNLDALAMQLEAQNPTQIFTRVPVMHTQEDLNSAI